MGQKNCAEMFTATLIPWGLQQVVSCGWAAVVQELGVGVNGVHMHEIDLSAGVLVPLAGNITTKVGFLSRQLGSNPSQQSKCDVNEAGKKALQKLSHSASNWDEYFCHQKVAINSSPRGSWFSPPPGKKSLYFYILAEYIVGTWQKQERYLGFINPHITKVWKK